MRLYTVTLLVLLSVSWTLAVPAGKSLEKKSVSEGKSTKKRAEEPKVEEAETPEEVDRAKKNAKICVEIQPLCQSMQATCDQPMQIVHTDSQPGQHVVQPGQHVVQPGSQTQILQPGVETVMPEMMYPMIHYSEPNVLIPGVHPGSTMIILPHGHIGSYPLDHGHGMGVPLHLHQDHLECNCHCKQPHGVVYKNISPDVASGKMMGMVPQSEPTVVNPEQMQDQGRAHTIMPFAGGLPMAISSGPMQGVSSSFGPSSFYMPSGKAMMMHTGMAMDDGMGMVSGPVGYAGRGSTMYHRGIHLAQPLQDCSPYGSVHALPVHGPIFRSSQPYPVLNAGVGHLVAPRPNMTPLLQRHYRKPETSAEPGSKQQDATSDSPTPKQAREAEKSETQSNQPFAMNIPLNDQKEKRNAEDVSPVQES